MYQVVKGLISSVSIDPGSQSDLSSSEGDSVETDLSAAFERTLNLSQSTSDSVEEDTMQDPNMGSELKIVSNHINLERTANGQIDDYLSTFNEGIVKRFTERKPFEEYSKVRDYDFGHSKLELISKFRDKSTLKEFIVQGIIDVPMEKLLALVMELNNRTKWDDTYLAHTMMSFDEKTKTDFIFSVSKYPFPLTKRTYVVSRTCYNYGDDVLVVLSAVTDKKVAPRKMRWATQVDEFESMLVVRNCEPEEVDGEKKVTKSEFLATYFENPKVLVPNSYLNFIIGQLVPGILNKMIIASKTMNYEQSVEYVKNMKFIPIPREM